MLHLLDPFRDQRTRWMQTTLTVVALAVVVGIAGSGLRVQAALQHAIAAYDTDVTHVIGPKSSPHALYTSALRAGPWTPDVLRAHQVGRALDRHVSPLWHAPLVRMGSSTHAASNATYGVDDRFWTRPPPLRSPSLATGRHPRPGQAEAVLGAEAARAMRVAPGAEVRVHTPDPREPQEALVSTTLTVVGVLEPGGGWDRAILTDIETARGVMPPLLDALSVISAPETIATHWLLHIPDGHTLTRHALFDTIHVKAADQVLDVPEVLTDLRAWTGTDGMLDRLLLLLAGLGVLGVLTLALQDRLESRRAGLATLRALGTPRRTLHLSLLLENLLFAGLGLLLGFALSWATEPLLLSRLSSGGPWLTPAPSSARTALIGWTAGAAILAAAWGQLRLRAWTDALLLRGI